METNTLGLFPFFALSNVAERGLLQLLSQKLFNKDNINYKTSILYRHSAVASCQLRSAAAATLLALRAISPIRGIYPASWGKQDHVINQCRFSSNASARCFGKLNMTENFYESAVNRLIR